MTNIWIKIKQDSQYQQDEVQDWVFYLQYLKSILIEFDLRCVSTEVLLCQYFYEGFKPSIKL